MKSQMHVASRETWMRFHARRTATLVLLGFLMLPPATGLTQAQKLGMRALSSSNRHARQYEWATQTRPILDGTNPTLARLDAYFQRQAFVRPSGDTSSWHPIGPWPASAGNYGTVSGRVTTLAIDPQHPNTIYSGAADGGVWKTTDNGTHWMPLTDNQPTLACGALAIDPTNTNVIYWGTGEQNGCGSLCYSGIGILKSTDGGTIWSMTGLQRAGSATFAIVIDPISPESVYAAMDNGVWRSSNGGTSWSSVLTGRATDLIMNPDTPAVIYTAISGAGLYKSTDGGSTWVAKTTGLPPAGQISRMTLALCASHPSTVYSRIFGSHPTVSGSDTNRVYRSTDAGETWSIVSAPISWSPQREGIDGNGVSGSDYTLLGVNDHMNPEGDEDDSGAQGWYNNYIFVDPLDPNIVYVGGIDIFRTTNGGGTWSNLSRGYQGGPVHVDQHALAFDPSNPSTIVIGNDGGVYRSTDRGTTWSNLNGDLNTIQFYSISVDPSSASVTYGGTQDNGTQRRMDGATWADVTGGDGGFTNVDYTNSSIVYGEYQNGFHLRSMDGGFSFSSIMNGIAEQGNWMTPVELDQNTASTLYTGTTKFYKTIDRGGTWSALGTAVDPSASPSKISAIGVTKANSQVIYAGVSTHGVFRSFNGGGKWTKVSTGLPSLWVSKILVDPDSSNVVYVTFSGYGVAHVFKSTDSGTSWINISSNLPNLPVNVIVKDPVDANTMYIGTDIGVYVTRNQGGSWTPFMNGLPNVAVNDMEFTPTGALRAATGGRGMWEYSVPHIAVVAIRVNPPEAGTVLPQQFVTRQKGDTVTVAVVGNPGYQFVNWSGDTSATANPILVHLWRDMDIVANFKSLSLPRDGSYTTTNSDRKEITFQWVELATDPAAVKIQPSQWHNRVPVADSIDDGTAGPILLDMPFYFYGSTARKESVYVGANGALSLTQANVNDLGNDGIGYYSNGWVIPGAPVQDLVSPFWNDLWLTPGNGHGEVYYKKDIANKKFIVEWYRAGDFNTSSDTTSTFEVILNGTSNGILFQYLSVGTTNLDSTAIIGIQKDAVTGLLYYLGGASRRPPELIVHDSLAISFNARFVVNVADNQSSTPETYALEQNYPNPFNPKTGVRFQVPALSGVEGPGVSDVKLVVYDLLGREVTTLVNERKGPGSYEVSFDGAGLSSGVYIYRLTAGSFIQSRKMILLK
jgi:photosystem II stability/assembly factor-like uncharacterized protein